MGYKVYKTSSEFHKKVEKLYDAMTELGLSISVGGNGSIMVTDNNTENFAQIVDTENGEPFDYFPCDFDYRLRVVE